MRPTSAPEQSPVGHRQRRGRASAVCRCCGGGPVEVFYEVAGVPVSNSLLLDSAEAARAVPTGDLVLGCCGRCGFIQNVAFDPSLVSYGDGYEDTQAHSPRFVEFATEVSRDLIERYGLQGADVLEVGCGKGDFLRIVCGLTGGRGVGYDPAIGPGALDLGTERLTFHAEPYTEAVREAAGLVACRHTLEHVPDVAGFVRMLADSLQGSSPLVFLEVPDTLRILTEAAFWDLYYEHCSYFTGLTLRWLFESQGFEVLDQRLGFDDQYLLLEARPGGPGAPLSLSPSSEDLDQLMAEVRLFSDRVGDLRRSWKERILAWTEKGQSMVIWGGGSKTVGFLAATGAADAVDAVVDINPRKHGRFLPASSQRVVAPEELQELDPDVVIVMNPAYEDEIVADLRSHGLDPEVQSL